MTNIKQPISVIRTYIETTVKRLNGLLEERGSAKRISITGRFGRQYVDVGEIQPDGLIQHVKTVESGTWREIENVVSGMAAMIDIVKL